MPGEERDDVADVGWRDMSREAVVRDNELEMLAKESRDVLHIVRIRHRLRQESGHPSAPAPPQSCGKLNRSFTPPETGSQMIDGVLQEGSTGLWTRFAPAALEAVLNQSVDGFFDSLAAERPR